MRKRLGKLIEKDGFYIILFICVCVVAITAVMVSKRNMTDSNKHNLSQHEDFIIVNDELDLVNSLETPKTEKNEILEEPMKEIEELEEEIMEDQEVKEAMAEGDKDEIEKQEVEDRKELEEDLDFVQEKNPPESIENMVEPVQGKLITDFTKDNLIYSQTLEEWTAHKGIDISADEGSQVVAALSGKVQEVYNDQLWGIVIILEHGNGLVTKYANLSEEDMVKEGTQVNKGDVIGKVGKTASIEMMMEPHIHFEVIKDGICVDPKEHIPAFIYSN
ncbi:M23 family metallopeptidase [Schnuerera sp.]|uniref:M23 family metallopeptidase n=1 Tax=Schnuerera sp. TaxID=2794844 RepID=UPI002C4A70C4|nr:M23 family metallopeptidase [Schnuerera sp.]HSH35345.1 M23 family metallopeptidase [Schnuerera sp.]